MQRNIYLDYLRGLSTLAVMVYHYTTRYDMLFGHIGDYPIYSRYGSYGVLVFFLLSGYLTFSRVESIQPKKFLKKRFLKLYPAYWIAMIFTACFTFFFLPELAVSLKDFILNFSMVQMYLGAKNVDGAYWTMSCELAFYFLIWLICIAKVRIEKAIIAWIIIEIIILALPNVGIMSMVKKLNDMLYLHCFMAGGMISLIEREVFDHNSKGSIVRIPVMTCVCVFFISQQFMTHEVVSGYFLLIIAVLLWLAIIAYRKSWTLPKYGGTILKPIAWIASISYPFYLFHQNIGYIIIKYLESHSFVGEYMLIVPFTIVTVLAYLLHKYIEEPLTRKLVISK